MPRYSIEIQCGETTCAESPGNFCKFVGSHCFGTKFGCNLFEGPIDDDCSGTLKRSPECLVRAKLIEATK